MSAPVAWVTAAACNYLPQVRVLARSFTDHHPGRRMTVLITDAPPPGVDLAAEPYDVLFPDDVAIPPGWLMTHTRKALAAASKPHLMRHVLERGAGGVVFVDPDMIVLGPMTDIDTHAIRHSLGLRPHLTRPGDRTDDALAFVEDQVLMAGMFNGGLVTASGTPEAAAFLHWWASVQDQGCAHDLQRAEHFDQRWLDLAPSMVDDIGLVRDPGLDVAFWSMPGAEIILADGTLMVDRHPCRLLHFTGFIPEDPNTLVAYFGDRFRLDAVPAFVDLYRAYCDALAREGRATWRAAPYGFGTFEDGSPVPDAGRRAYAEMGAERHRFGDPFRTGRGSFHEWLAAPADDGAPPIPREWMEAHAHQPRIHGMFPDPLGEDRHRFHAWIGSAEAREARQQPYLMER